MTPRLKELVERIQGLFRPFIYDPEVEAYIKDMYQLRNSLSFTYHKRNIGPTQLTYYQDYSGQHHKQERYFSKGTKVPAYRYFAIKPHIKPNTQYQFPLHFPSAFEEEYLYDPEFVEELKTFYQPFKRRAYYLFDAPEYERYLANNYLDPDADIHCFANHWQGPYLSDRDWLAILKWVYQKTRTKYLPVKFREEELQNLESKLRNLEYTYYQTTYETIEFDWYEPEPIMEPEYLQAAREWGRIIGDYTGRAFQVGDNCKYRARLGPSPYGSDEVANRTANQIKQLAKFTARVRLPSGEYTIQTIAPLPATDITKRVKQIYDHNILDGFLRLRSDVEKELLSQPAHQTPHLNHTPVPAIPLPAKPRKK